MRDKIRYMYLQGDRRKLLRKNMHENREKSRNDDWNYWLLELHDQYTIVSIIFSEKLRQIKSEASGTNL